MRGQAIGPSLRRAPPRATGCQTRTGYRRGRLSTSGLTPAPGFHTLAANMSDSNPVAHGTIGIVLIGNELLSGSVRDLNSDYIIRSFSTVGYSVGEIRIIPDDRERIAETLRALAPRFEYVITSGGIGPTHDDVTLEAAASGFGVELVEDPTMAAFLDNHYGGRMNEALRRMARVPAGADVGLNDGQVTWPLIRFRNVFILPGLPRALRDKVDRIIAQLQPLGHFATAEIFLRAYESDYVDWLNSFIERHTDVSVGSYPYWENPEYRTRITVRSRDSQAVRVAIDELVSYANANGWLVRWSADGLPSS